MKTLTGMFIQPTEEQQAQIWTAVAAHGFTQDSAGVLALLMLAVEAPEMDEDEEDAPPNFEKAAEYLMNNPEQVAKAIDAGKKAIVGLFGKLGKK